MKELEDLKDGHVQVLRGCERATDRVHVFDKNALLAMEAALAARRPLLVRGEPGTGKSQLALAAATSLGRPLLSYVVNSRTTAQDLLWSFDAVARLAEAQLAGALQRLARSTHGEGTAAAHEAKPGSSRDTQVSRQQQSIEDVRQLLDERRFVTPGPLWWALDWRSAEAHAAAYRCPIPERPQGWDTTQGTVVLIDEIDKAESDVPNGLLEVLGMGRFRPQGYPEPFQICGAEQPLILITTNEERALPDAFVRRCLVLNLQLPTDDRELEAFLIARGRAHFQSSEHHSVENKADDAVLQAAARQLIKDRNDLKARSLPPPGQAEYLDLVRAVIRLRRDREEQLQLLKELSNYVFQKHPE